MARHALLAAALPALLSAGALAQAPAYNRALAASDIAYAGSSTGGQISGRLHIDGDGSTGGDLSCRVRAFAGGVPVGEPYEFHISVARGEVNCTNFCLFCRMNSGVCFDFRYLCVCLGSVGNGATPTDRFVIPTPPLHEGELVTLHVEPLENALPEIVTADDSATFSVGHPACPGDITNDGVLNSQDFFAFVTAFFQGAPLADFNADGGVNSQDFFDFLGAFFNGC